MSIDQYSWKCNALLNSTCIENIGTDFTWNLSACNLWDHWMTSLWDLLTVYTRDLLAITMFDLIVCLCPQVKFYLESPTSALHRSHVLLPSLTQVHMTCYLHLLISQQTKELINKQTNKQTPELSVLQTIWMRLYLQQTTTLQPAATTYIFHISAEVMPHHQIETAGAVCVYISDDMSVLPDILCWWRRVTYCIVGGILLPLQWPYTYTPYVMTWFHFQNVNYIALRKDLCCPYIYIVEQIVEFSTRAIVTLYFTCHSTLNVAP